MWIPAGVKHWHGATDTNGMSHIAVTYIRDGKNADWMELVTDQEYDEPIVQRRCGKGFSWSWPDRASGSQIW